MKNPKVGERVVAYQGTIRMIGNIVEIDEDGVLKVRDDNSFNQWFHAKQCRRLKPKRKPEVVEFECQWASDVDGPYPFGYGAYLQTTKFIGKRTKVRLEVLE